MNQPNQIVFQVYQNQELPFRFHEGLSVFFGLTGSSRILCGSREYELLPAGLLVVNPFELYRLSCPADGAVIGLQLARPLLQIAGWKDTDCCSCYVRSGDGLEYNPLREQYAEIFQDFFQGGGAQASCTGSAIQLLGLLQSRFSVHDPDRLHRESTMQRLRRMLEFIHKHWNEELRLADIAQQEYLSVSYLSRFFQKHLHMPFSQYVRELRLRHAAQTLAQTSGSITHLAYDCGFRTPGVFIDAFKQYYGRTPRRYRQEMQRARREQTPENNQRDDLAVLVSYIKEKTVNDLPRRTYRISAQCAPASPKALRWRRILNIGYARDGLMAPVQEQIRRAQREIGFEYLRFHGLFDEDMHIYSEDEHGKPQFNFAYPAMLFDFILSLGLKPYVELSFLPNRLAREQTRIFDRPSVISGCADLDKWSLLVRAAIRFFIERYGMEEVESWRFTTIGKGYAHIGCIGLEEHEALYCATYRAVKTAHPRCQFGGPGGFAYLIREKHGVPRFLDIAEAEGCVPDFISMQCHPHMQTGEDALFMDFTLNQQSAPAVLSKDPDFMAHALDDLQALLKQHGLDREIYIEECNSTLWQRDLSGDTCYKAAWLAKNVCETRGRIVFGYWLLTDLLEERATLESVFHGGYGLFTYNGIPKAGYQAMRLLSKMGDMVLDRGPGWMLARSHEGYQLMLYHYCDYSNLYRYRYKRLEKPEDAYTVFEPGEIRRLQFQLSGIPDGIYRVERFAVTRKEGSAFDRWMEIGAPRNPDAHAMQYLAAHAGPSYRRETVRAETGLRLEALLEPHEIQLLVLRPLEGQ